MGEFNSDDHYIYTVGKNLLEEMRSPHSQQKSRRCSTWVQLKRQKDLRLFARQTTQYQSNASLCPNHWSPRSWSRTVLWRLQDLPELRPTKDVLFILGDWSATVRSQEIPGVTGKFGLGAQNEAGQRLTEFCQENPLVIANTLFQQHKRRLYTWTSLYGQHKNQIDYTLCSQRWRKLI